MDHASYPPFRLLFAIILVAFGTSFPFGFNLGVINLTQGMLEDFVNGSDYAEHGQSFEETGLKAMWSFIVSSFTLGGAVGGLICPIFAEKLGRKKSLIVSSVFMCVASLCMALSKTSNSYELFTLGRTIAGLSSGLGASLLSIYLSEISPIEFRGFSGGFLEILLVLGKFVSLLLSLSYILGSRSTWPYLVALPIIPSLVSILVLPFLPETPKYLRAKGMSGTSKAIRFYHGDTSDVKHVLKEIDKELEVVEKQLSLMDIMRNKVFRHCLLMTLVVRIAQECTGITAIFNFSTGIFLDLEFSTAFSSYNSIGIAGMSAVVTITAVFFVEHKGRRPLLVYGLLGTLICDVLFMIFGLLYSQAQQRWAGYICVALLYIHVFLFSCGPGPVGWLVVPEFVPQVARAGVTSAGVFINWASNLGVTAAFLPLKDVIGYYSFLMFAVPLAICTAYLFVYLPETRNRPVDEIAKSIARGDKGYKKTLIIVEETKPEKKHHHHKHHDKNKH